MGTHYEVLGLPPTASQAEIGARYRQLAKQSHPDMGGDKARFQRVSEAHRTLSNDHRRRAYDLLIEMKARERPLATRIEVWANIAIALVFAFGACWLWAQGDRPRAYSGWLVASGWAAMILAWRVFADRRFKFRNPLVSLAEGVTMVALSALEFAWQMAVLAAVMFGLLGLITLAEKIGPH